MTPIQELLHRIQWDREFGRAYFEIGVLDRVEGRIVRVPFREVRVTRGGRPVLETAGPDGVVRTIPLHRVREVLRDGVVVWQRGPVDTPGLPNDGGTRATGR